MSVLNTVVCSASDAYLHRYCQIRKFILGLQDIRPYPYPSLPTKKFATLSVCTVVNIPLFIRNPYMLG